MFSFRVKAAVELTCLVALLLEVPISRNSQYRKFCRFKACRGEILRVPLGASRNQLVFAAMD